MIFPVRQKGLLAWGMAAALVMPAPLFAQDSGSQVMGPGVVMAQNTTLEKMDEDNPAPDQNSVVSMAHGVMNDLTNSTWVKQSAMEQQQMTLVAGRSHLLRLKRKVGRVSVSDPEVLDVVVLSPSEILLNARDEGAVNLILWDYLNQVTVFDITVHRDPNLLQALLSRIAPDSQFEIFPSEDVFVVKGNVHNVNQQKEVERAANAFAEGSVSLVHVEKPKQVLLKIRYIQLSHTNGLDFGIDMEHDRNNDKSNVLTRFLPGGTTAETDTDSNNTFINPSTTFDSFGRNDTDLFQIARVSSTSAVFGFIKAIEAQGLGKVIARPDLLAEDGEEATFLVGGEAAVVAISDNNVGVEYREFGTRLSFTPQILDDDRIRLTVAPEVSAIDTANAVQVNNVNIPSFTTIRASTTVELKDGETFIIGGLLQQKMTMNDTGVPFLRRLPLVGKLFTNVDHNYEDTELLIIVTPQVIEPLKDPVMDDPESGDMLGEATAFLPNKFKNDKASKAIEKFLKENKRFIHKQISRMEGRPDRFEAAETAEGPDENKDRVSIPGNEAPRMDSLEKLQQELQWQDEIFSRDTPEGPVVMQAVEIREEEAPEPSAEASEEPAAPEASPREKDEKSSQNAPPVSKKDATLDRDVKNVSSARKVGPAK